jgi:uncharacterized membrane protein
MDDNEFQQVPVVVYGLNLLLAAVAYFLLQRRLLRLQGPQGDLAVAIGGDWKGKASPVIYLVGIALSFLTPALSLAAYTVVALIWLVPDRRVERFLAGRDGEVSQA